jgi:membrane protease YdiL (CAAX protease family)
MRARGHLIRPNVAVVIAILGELIFIVGGTLIRRRFPGAMTVPGELVISAWRLVFIALFGWLYLYVLRNGRGSRLGQWHPLLVVAIVIELAALPLAGYGVEGGWEPLLVFFFVGIPLAAITEELFYRAILQSALEWILHPLGAIVLSSALFVLSHIETQPIFTNVPIASSIAATGVILGVIYQRTRNLLLVVILHTLLDWILFVPKLHLVGPLTVTIGNGIALLMALIWWSSDSAKERIAT